MPQRELLHIWTNILHLFLKVGQGWTSSKLWELYQGGTNWPLEIAGHWLEGALGLSIILNDTALFNKVSKRLDLVVNGVLNGGESFIFWEPKGVLIDKDGSKNNWGHHIMGRTLVTYYHATHDKKILQALVKIYKHFPLQDIFYDSEIAGIWITEYRANDRDLPSKRRKSHSRHCSGF